MVYVLAHNGSPLMPTKNHGYVRKLLSLRKAVVVQTKPFTIRLKYQTEEKTRPLVCGIDPGRTNIGVTVVTENGKTVFSANAVTNNKDVPKRMAERKAHRMASRNGERKRRQRRAVANGTYFETKERTLPGCEKPITCKAIRNSEARFNNRRRPDGWLTPTANHLLACHLNLLSEVRRRLPVSMVVLEVNTFAFMALDNPHIHRWQYQRGPLFGQGSVKDAVYAAQNGHCLFCECCIDHYHHVKPRSKGGSETLDNRVGLCERHHILVHTDIAWAGKLADTKAGLNKKYGALSVLNQIIPRMIQELVKTGLAVRVTEGRSTKAYREVNGIEKDHNLDAYCIACSALEAQPIIDPPTEHYDLRRFRRHDRAAVARQEERKYYMDGTLVARNRRKRMEQQTDSLAEFLAKHPDAVGRLKVVKGGVKYKNPKRILPGAIFSVDGERMVFQGSHGKSKVGKPNYYEFVGKGNFTPRKCRLISTGGGWQFI